MKKSELLGILNSIDGDPEIILSKDGEGNEYLPLDSYNDKSVFIKDVNSYNGEILDTGWSAEDAGMEESEWEEIKKQPRCLVLYP